jgi:hypothetical protein
MLRKITQIVTFCFFVVFATKANASSIADAFSFDASSIELEFASVKPLENYLIENFESADFDFVKQSNGVLLANVASVLNVNPSLPLDSDKNPILGIPSFVWGFCLGILGIVAVAVIGDDLPKDERQTHIKKAAVGCLASSALYIVYYFAVLGSAL